MVELIVFLFKLSFGLGFGALALVITAKIIWTITETVGNLIMKIIIAISKITG